MKFRYTDCPHGFKEHLANVFYDLVLFVSLALLLAALAFGFACATITGNMLWLLCEIAVVPAVKFYIFWIEKF